jgi:hypothetical protein
VAGDVIIGNSDMPGAKEIAARIKRIIPPQALGDDDTDPQAQIQKLGTQLQRAQQINQQLMQHNQQMMDDLKTEKIQQDGKMAIVQLQTAAQVEVAALNAKLDAARLDFEKWELGATQAHELALAKVGQKAAADQQDSQQEHEKDLAATPPPPDPNAAAPQGA